MRIMKLKTIIFFLTMFGLTACGQTNNDRTNLGIEYAKTELKDALANTKDKLILVDKVITDKETAISISETILFKIYGKNNIIKQRPYEVNKIENYWILNGTLPKKMLGGTFLIIINSTNGQIIKLTYGK
jgi:hypothetical protein